ncbi:hypothetical protein GGU10DRAFT_374114 [Lentinula aff. detonsa]|uniref:LysM domain-containing protein n=1 Tax=Lentinula aff. detonsa TaxID=2804958 RepID=A0AA38L6E5_9AGAR|nr:hypothetical protein GGU10DRAFT_374114 [Lentinula aff. detonsa]
MFARLSLFAMVTALGVIGANSFAVPRANIYSRATCQATYTVVAGDTCNKIASEFGVTTPALEAANPTIDANCDNLFIGEILCIPGTPPPPPPPTCVAEYTVKAGDVCNSIANQFDITVAQLEAANPEIDPLCDNLQINQILCIP